MRLSLEPFIPWVASVMSVIMEIIIGIAVYTIGWLVSQFLFWLGITDSSFVWWSIKLYYFMLVWATLSVILTYLGQSSRK
jgi:hypothetical protein